MNRTTESALSLLLTVVIGVCLALALDYWIMWETAHAPTADYAKQAPAKPKHHVVCAPHKPTSNPMACPSAD